MIVDLVDKNIPIEEIKQYALENKVSLPKACLVKNIHPVNTSYWHSVPVYSLEDDVEEERKQEDLFTLFCPEHLKPFVESICAPFEFPKSTAFFHMLGVVASTCMHSVRLKKFETTDAVPLNLYTIASHPSGTGKSSINKFMMNRIQAVFSQKNKDRQVERSVIKKMIEMSNNEILAATKSKGDANEIKQIIKRAETEIRYYMEDLEKVPLLIATVNDLTPEALESKLQDTAGKMAIVVDEASAIEDLLGTGYSKKKKQGITLSAWDSEYYLSIRTTRTAFEGRATLGVACIAQDVAFKQLIENGLDGNGVAQRFLVYSEPDKLGYRTHDVKFKAIESHAYDVLIENICAMIDKPIELTFDKYAQALFTGIKQAYEPDMRDGGRYSLPALQGYIGKAHHQIARIAGVLHMMNHFSINGDKRTVIDYDTTQVAKRIFNECAKTFKKVVDEFQGSNATSEKEYIVKRLVSYRLKNNTNIIKIEALRSMIRGHSAFLGRKNISKYLKEHILPELEQCGYLVFHGSIIAINVNIKDM